MSKPGFNVSTDDVSIQLVGTVTHQPGAIRLDGYPCLVYAPKQLGPGVRLNDTHMEVEEIYHVYLSGEPIPDPARQYQTDERHIHEAIAYARASRIRERE